MLLCDNIINEGETKKKSLIGVFDRLTVADFAAAAGFWVTLGSPTPKGSTLSAFVLFS
jgi:hypothetical protein